MSTEPLVSVITIFLDGDRFIEEAIESVLAQTYANWELLLVDDGSSDRSTAIAKDFAARFTEKIRYLEHEGHVNRGMSASRNLGLKHARGEYVSYLDADDVWRPNKMLDQSRLLLQYPEAAYVYGPLELWRSWTGRPSDKDESQELGLTADRIVQPPELLNLFLRNDKNIPSGIMVRASALARVGDYEERFTTMCEDQIVHAKICLAHPVYASSKSWYRYRQHPDSCNAQAWRSGGYEKKIYDFLLWLEGYLIHSGITQGETWETLHQEMRHLRRSFRQRLPEFWNRQAGRTRRLASKIRRKTRAILDPPPVILCYHRVHEPKIDPHKLSVSRENFRQQLDVIKQLANPLTLDELAEALPGQNFPRRSVLITFDDGYLDNLTNALPLLRGAQLPAAIYVATGYLDSNREFWWDDLERLVLGPGNLPPLIRLRINGRWREWGLETPSRRNGKWNVHDVPNDRTPRQRLFCELHMALRPLARPAQLDVLEQLRGLTGVPNTPRPLYRCLAAEELSTLAGDPLITIGGHTITHCDLDYCTKEQQDAEIAGSRQCLEEIIGGRVEHFSYPYGSFNGDCLAVCAEQQFRSAVAGISCPVRPNSHRFALPRFFVRDCDGPTFERELRRFARG